MPAFSLSTLDDRTVTSESWRGTATVVVFVRPRQARSEAALKDTVAARRDLGDLPWRSVAIIPGNVPRERIEALIKGTAFGGTVLLDPARTVYGTFGVIAMPSTVVVDRDGQIVFAKPG